MRQRRVFLNQAEYIKTMDTLSAHGHGHLIPRVGVASGCGQVVYVSTQLK